jgi:hypothetical protein
VGIGVPQHGFQVLVAEEVGGEFSRAGAKGVLQDKTLVALDDAQIAPAVGVAESAYSPEGILVVGVIQSIEKAHLPLLRECAVTRGGGA